MQVLVNDLENVPHGEGQTVLHVARSDFTVQVKYACGRYHIWGVVCRDGAAQFTRLAAERATIDGACDLARRLWREGEQYNTIQPAG